MDKECDDKDRDDDDDDDDDDDGNNDDDDDDDDDDNEVHVYNIQWHQVICILDNVANYTTQSELYS